MASEKDYLALNPNLVLSPSKAHDFLFAKLRDINTSSADFVKYAKRAMHILAEDALAEFPVNKIIVETPCGTCESVERNILKETANLCAVSVVRSGDALLEIVREIEPACKVGKILIQRDESTKEKTANLIYEKLPHDIASSYVLLCDPMLATGGSAIQALNVLCNQHGVKQSNIIFANLICAPEGLKAMASTFPEVKIVTIKVDECLNDEMFIVPGLGDFGDRFFNTC